MDAKALIAQALDYQKTMFDNSFSTMTTLQDQGEEMMIKALEKTPLMAEDSRKVYTYWSDFFKKNRDNYKTCVDANFTRVKEMFETVAVKAAQAAPAAPAAPKKETKKEPAKA